MTDALEAAERKWRWAALLLQMEALGLLALRGFELIYATRTPPPAPAIFSLVVAALLLPLGSAIGRGSHAAGLVLVPLMALRVMAVATSPPSRMLWLAPLLLLELFVFGRALMAMARTAAVQREPQNAGQRVVLWLITILPLMAAAMLLSRGEQLFQRAVVSSDLGAFERAADRVGIAVLFMGVVLMILHRVPERLSLALSGRKLQTHMPFASALSRWPRIVWLDLSAGLVLTISALLVLRMTASVAAQPDLMLVPSALLIPMFAIGFLPLGMLWIGIGIAEIHGKPWTTTARIVAAIPVLLMLFIIGPAIGSIAVYLVQSIAASFAL